MGCLSGFEDGSSFAGFHICAFDALRYQKFFQSNVIIIVTSNQRDRLSACESKEDYKTKARLMVQQAESVCLEMQGELGLRGHGFVDTVGANALQRLAGRVKEGLLSSSTRPSSRVSKASTTTSTYNSRKLTYTSAYIEIYRAKVLRPQFETCAL